MSIKRDCRVARLRCVTNKTFACENNATKWPRKRRRIALSAYSVCDFRQKNPNKNRHLLCVCMCAEHCYKLKQSQIHTHPYTHSTTLVCLVGFSPGFPRKMLFMHFRNFQRFSLYFYLRLFYAHISRSSLAHRVQRRITICSCCYCCCYCCGFTPLLLLFCGNIRFKLG